MPTASNNEPARVARISVVMPCMNDGDLLVEAVGSIREREPVEMVVVDDCSDDPTTQAALARVEGHGVQVIRHQSNRGVSAARNSGLAATSGRYVFPLDSDDLALPGTLARMADRLDAEPAAAACFGDYVEFGDQLLIRGVPERIDPFRIAYTNHYPASALFRRSVLEGLGGWKRVGDQLDARADWSLWMTLAEHYATGVHLGRDDLTYLRRIHHGRLAEAARRHHRQIYRQLRAAHPRLFADLRASRRSTEVGLARKYLYPVVYGTRAWWPFEPTIIRWLDRRGLWALARPLEGKERDRVADLVSRTRKEAVDHLHNGNPGSSLGYDRPASDVLNPANP